MRNSLMNKEFEAKRQEMRNDFEVRRKEMDESFKDKKRKMTITFWKYVISAISIMSLLGGYLIYRYGYIITELYDSLIVYLNK
jgi:hypothetical protein